jgi:hypothetical protein
MKKITLALVLLLAIGLIGATAEVTATISGSATATIGFDLDSSAFGMVNAPTTDMTITIASMTSTSEMVEGWYGYASVTGSLVYDDDTAGGNPALAAPSITAKITDGTTYVQIWALDGFATDMATAVENAGSGFPAEGDDSATDIAVDLTAAGSGGVTFGTVAGPATIAVFFATETGYAAPATSAENGHFLVGTDVTLAVDPATIKLAVVKGLGVVGDEELGISASVGLTAGPATIGLAFDSVLPDGGGAFDFEIRGDVSVALGDIKVALAAFYGKDNIDIELSTAPVFGPITVSLLVGVYDLTTTLAYVADVGVSYKVNDMITVAVDSGYDSLGTIPLSIAATIANPIPNVTMVLKYATTDIAASILGQVTFATTVKL